jgi:hypothetical protein
MQDLSGQIWGHSLLLDKIHYNSSSTDSTTRDRCLSTLSYKQLQASAGPTGYQQFMSPYQQDVINTTLQNLIDKHKKVYHN